MKKMTFEAFIKANAQVVEEIRHIAWNLHESVGQTYDKNLPMVITSLWLLMLLSSMDMRLSTKSLTSSL